MSLLSSKVFTLYHSTTVPLSSVIRIKGKNDSYGFFLAKSIKYSKTFGDITYKVKVRPKNILILNDSEAKKQPFFNINEKQFNEYIKKYDSIAWYRKGILTEFIVLDNTIIKEFYTI